ncbi:hypothetical protein CcI156_11020 [Frankia sp. CcI156]|uniref:hypothetical protein n=1 Tax=Frankia TaxID=1854 RepID=UPI00055A78EE|nr:MULTISPECIES: hypothetical protein [Frankia]ONH26297.1 hypothetical protein CcI156_11020 [Frankia sp. CcI156]ORT51632.1 hypothetical protein KBI5_11035 [Frankia sp. KB5]ORT94587.1 hypothetical protein UK99_15910 [Frankia casuarinae]
MIRTSKATPIAEPACNVSGIAFHQELLPDTAVIFHPMAAGGRRARRRLIYPRTAAAARWWDAVAGQVAEVADQACPDEAHSYS